MHLNAFHIAHPLRWLPSHAGLKSAIAGSCIALAGCTGAEQGTTGSDSLPDESADTTSTTAPLPASRSFRPDNDIAMTVRSMVQTINEGESLDSTAYNFEGVLTDGTGAPLFTDFEGMPGQWSIDVNGPQDVVIHNLGTGDLWPDELIDYIRTALVQDKEDADTDDAPSSPEMKHLATYDEGETRVEEWAYGKTKLRIETTPETLPTGQVGPRLQIRLVPDSLPPHPADMVHKLPPAPNQSHTPFVK